MDVKVKTTFVKRIGSKEKIHTHTLFPQISKKKLKQRGKNIFQEVIREREEDVPLPTKRERLERDLPLDRD